MYNTSDLQKEAEHVVYLFEMAHRRAQQLLKEEYHPEDLYVNASTALHAYECLLDFPKSKS